MTDSFTFWEQLWASRHVVMLFTFFVVAVAFAFRPGAGKRHEDAARSIFRNEDAPADDTPTTEART